jgi:hypothetical protein
MLKVFGWIMGMNYSSGALRAKKSKLDLDPGVARETRLPQATLGHAFSVKMQAGCPRSQRYARAISVKMRSMRTVLNE